MNGALRMVILGVLLGLGCTSPEVTRTRGGGPGADVGNRQESLRLHEGARHFANTPKLIPGTPPPLEPADQADASSRR